MSRRLPDCIAGPEQALDALCRRGKPETLYLILSELVTMATEKTLPEDADDPVGDVMEEWSSLSNAERARGRAYLLADRR